MSVLYFPKRKKKVRNVWISRVLKVSCFPTIQDFCPCSYLLDFYSHENGRRTFTSKVEQSSIDSSVQSLKFAHKKNFRILGLKKMSSDISSSRITLHDVYTRQALDGSAKFGPRFLGLIPCVSVPNFVFFGPISVHFSTKLRFQQCDFSRNSSSWPNRF